MFSHVFTEERIEFGHTTIKPRSVECCSDVCPSIGFSHLHIMIMELNYSDHKVLGHQSRQGPSPPIGQFDQEAGSRKSPG